MCACSTPSSARRLRRHRRCARRDLSYRLGAPGRHLVQNSLAVLAAVKLAGADLAPAARALAELAGPGRARRAHHHRRPDRGRIAIIDESYNANPASMRAALAILGLTPRSEFKRRVAVLGDMLGTRPGGRQSPPGARRVIDETGVDVVFACGELMGGLFQALPASRQGAYAKTAEELEPMLLARSDPGTRSWSKARSAAAWAAGRSPEAPFRQRKRAGLSRA